MMTGRLGLLGVVISNVIIAVGPFIFLFADRVAYGNSAFGSILREVAAAFRDAGTQWIVFLCLGVYFVVFNLLRFQVAARLFWRLHNPDLWLAAALATGSLVYALNYSVAAASTQALMLLAGATLGQVVAVWSEWRPHKGTRHRLLLMLVALLVVGALWHPDAGRDFAYHGYARWIGPWNNPNLFGLLMGMGMVVAVGQISERLRIGEDGSRGRSPAQFVGLHIVFFLAAAVVMVVGLLNSYSRGAWMATACGLVYLFSDVSWFSRVSRLSPWIRRNRFALSAVLVSVIVLAFWQVHQVEHTLVRRALSAGNLNDFSWRNRVAAWEGTLQMMAEKPWFGFGCQQPERVYENFYRLPNVTESGAIQMNDHLMLGTSLGLPAFLCFLICVGLSLWGKAEGKRQKEESGGQKDEGRIATWNSVRASCRAGAVVLLVGFWFDGGLFNLATAAPFWILLELGQARPQMNENREGPILTTDEHR